jgi:hypothetical protein
MALITSAECTLISCGTCGAQMLLEHRFDRGDFIGQHNTVDTRADAFIRLHRANCPDRMLVSPATKENTP